MITMELSVRPAAIDDLPAVVDIYNQAIRAGGATGDMNEFTVDERIDWFNRFKSDEFPLLVAESDKKVVGYISLSPYRPGRKAFSDVAEISFFVDYSCHGIGVGKKMMEQMMNNARMTGKRVLLAILLEVNRSSIALLESHGFKRWGHLPGIGNFDGQYIGQYIYGINLG